MMTKWSPLFVVIHFQLSRDHINKVLKWLESICQWNISNGLVLQILFDQCGMLNQMTPRWNISFENSAVGYLYFSHDCMRMNVIFQ